MNSTPTPRRLWIIPILLTVLLTLVAACSPVHETTVMDTGSLVTPTGIKATIPVIITETPDYSNFISTPDLSAFIQAWNSGDVEAIRSYYEPEAVYLSSDEALAIQQKEPVDPLVSSDAFAGRIKTYSGLRLRILGKPIQVTEKQVGYLYRWEGGSDGVNGVAILRYENGKIWMHTYIEDAVATPNPAEGSDPVGLTDLSQLAAVWSSGDMEKAKSLYTMKDGAYLVFNDENIALSLRGRTMTAGALEGGNLASELLGNGKAWGMQIIGEPQQLNDLVLAAWSWKAFNHPMGYGIRLMRIVDNQVAVDIRYAFRPWEVAGKPFISGY